MFRVELPERPWHTPSTFTRDYASQKNYWDEKFGYEISQTQANEMRSAIAEVSSLFIEAMDYVMSHDDVLQTFYITKDKSKNRKALQLAKWSWEQERNRNYIFDRLDLAWDGKSPPKVLERNFGHLGLIAGTGVVQDDYINWLKSQKGYDDIESFGDLKPAVISAFAIAAEQVGLGKRESFAVIALGQSPDCDQGMVRAGKLLTSWFRAAGYMPVYTPCTSHIGYDGADRLLINDEYIQIPFRIGRFMGKKLPVRISEPTGKLIFSQRVITSAHAFVFCGGDGYAQQIANKIKRTQIPVPHTKPITPYWTLVMGNKALLAVLYKFISRPSKLVTNILWQQLHEGTKAYH